MLAINHYCPHSGKPIVVDSLTQYRGFTVGFCNPGCRDDFAANPGDFPRDLGYFDALIREHHLERAPLNSVHDAHGFSETTALVLIDIQNAFDHPKWGERNNPGAEVNAARLLAGWRASGRPIVHIRHISPKKESLFHAGSTTSKIKDLVSPQTNEPVFTKEVNSAFIGTPLEAWLRERGCETVVIAGLTTPHCVSTTTRMAGNLGFNAYLVTDATAAFALIGPDGQLHSAEEIHRVSLATLHDEFAKIIDTAMAITMLTDDRTPVPPEELSLSEP